jgi:hypothetical protein
VVKGCLVKGKKQVAGIFSCLGDKYIAQARTKKLGVPIKAGEKSDIAFITKIDFEACTGGNFAKVVMTNKTIESLKRVQLLHNLTPAKLSQIAEAM